MKMLWSGFSHHSGQQPLMSCDTEVPVLDGLCQCRRAEESCLYIGAELLVYKHAP